MPKKRALKPRVLTAADVTFEVTTEAGDINEVAGHFATDDPKADRAQEREIIERLEAGDDSAWCGVIATATWTDEDGNEYTGSDSIWACVLSDDYTEETVAEHHGVREAALADLNRNIAARVKAYSRLVAS